MNFIPEQTRKIFSPLFRPLAVKKYHFLLLLLGGFCFFFSALIWFPGVVHNDGVAQYLQVIGQAPASDWHPPILMRVWQAEISLLHNPDLFFLFPLTAFVFGLILLLWDVRAPFSLFLFGIIFFCPFYFVFIPEILKDNLFIAGCFLFSGILSRLFFTTMRKEIYWLIVGFELVLLIFCSLLRFNAIFLTAPLFLLLFRKWRFSIPVLASCLGIVLLSVGLTPFINQRLLKARPDYPVTSLQLFDIAGINHFKLHAPASQKVLEHWHHYSVSDQLGACYERRSWDSLGNWNTPEQRKPLMVMIEDGDWINWGQIEQRSNLRWQCSFLGEGLRANPKIVQKFWKENLAQHPFAYLVHRISFFSVSTLGIGKPWHLVIANDYPGYTYPDEHIEKKTYPKIADIYFSIIRIFRCLPWWNGYFWFLLCPAIFFFTWRSRHHQTAEFKIANAFAFSGFCYLLGYFFVGVGADFRYITPTATVTVCACLCLYRFYFVKSLKERTLEMERKS